MAAGAKTHECAAIYLKLEVAPILVNRDFFNISQSETNELKIFESFV